MATDHNKLPPEGDDDELPPLLVTSLSAVNFLVIDDNDISLELMERLLKAVQARGISTARDAFAAVGMLAKQSVKTDCIICDQRLEGLSGLALLQRIRAGRNSVIPRDTRFILATDEPSAELVQTAIRLDVNGFIAKPIGVNAVLKSVQLAFGRATRLKSANDYSKIALPA